MLQPAIDGEADVDTEEGMEVGAVDSDRVVAVGCQ